MSTRVRLCPLLRAAALPISLLITVWLATACASKTSPSKSNSARPVDDLRARVLRTLSHDRNAFTQGLVYHEGKVYESTGLVGRSSLRRVDLDTGRVEQSVPVEAPFFGEGLARVGGELVQLTWQNGKAFVWDMSGLGKVKEFEYQGEGWGLCHDGKRLVMSDGSDKLTFRDAGSFAVTGSVNVTRAGQPVRHLNELECVDKVVYANIWGSDNIARIDPATGEVTGWIDAGGLLSRTEIMGTDVLNGIAHMPDKNTFLITGKLWPRLFEVEFIPAGSLPRGATMNKAFGNDDPALARFIHDLYRPEDPQLREVRERAGGAGLPGIQVAALDARHLEVLVRLTGVRKAVEIGTLAGYSAVSIVRGMLPDGTLYTIEGDPHHADVAAETFRKAGITGRVRQLRGPALSMLPPLAAEGPFDFVFIDADKESYDQYLDWAAANLRRGGVVAGDNAFLFGHLYTTETPPSQGQKAMRAFHQRLAESGEFRATVLPTGEGLAVGVKL